MKEILAYIGKNYRKPITLAEIANRHYLSLTTYPAISKNKWCQFLPIYQTAPFEIGSPRAYLYGPPDYPDFPEQWFPKCKGIQ